MIRCYLSFSLKGVSWTSLVLALILASACNRLIPAGTYPGILSIGNLKDVPEMTDRAIEAEVKYKRNSSKGTILLHALPQKTDILRPATFSFDDDDNVELNIPDIQGRPILLYQVLKDSEGMTCYAGYSDYRERIEFCQNSYQFSLRIRENDLVKVDLLVNRLQNNTGFKLEEPAAAREFTISEAIELALNKNLDLLASKEEMIQAQFQAKTAYLNLVPHLNINLINSVTGAFPELGGGVVNLIGGVGQLVPFLLPTRWIKASEVKWQSEAQRLAHLLARANTASAVHILTINYLNHVLQKQEFEDLRNQVHQFSEEVKAVEEKNLIESGSTATIKTSLHDVEIALLQANVQINQDLTMLSKALGFMNPNTVKGIKTDLKEEPGVIPEDPKSIIPKILPEIPPKILNDEELEKEKQRMASLALFNSFELIQQNCLKKAAEIDAKGVFLNWMDPFSPEDRSLGFSLISEYQRTKSVIRAIELKVSSTRQGIIENAFSTVYERNEMLKFFRLAIEALQLRKERFKQIRHEFNSMEMKLKTITKNYSIESETKIPFDSDKYQNYTTDLVNGIRYFSASRTAFQLDQVALDRMALRGFYQRLLPYMGRIKTFDAELAGPSLAAPF